MRAITRLFQPKVVTDKDGKEYHIGARSVGDIIDIPSNPPRNTIRYRVRRCSKTNEVHWDWEGCFEEKINS